MEAEERAGGFSGVLASLAPRARARARRTSLAVSIPQDHPFLEFWSRYPRKEKKAAAWKVWQDLDPDAVLLTRIAETLAWQCRSARWLEEGGRFIPLPTSWLNGRRWEDEPPAVALVSARTASNIAAATEAVRLIRGKP